LIYLFQDFSDGTVAGLNAIAMRHKEEIGALIRFQPPSSGSFDWLMYGETHMWKFCVQECLGMPGPCTFCPQAECGCGNSFDVNTLSEHTVFENEDFSRQCNILFGGGKGFDIRKAFAGENLCRTWYFGLGYHAALNDPYQRRMLLENYGTNALEERGKPGMGYDWHLLYPRYFWRTDLGRWLYCVLGYYFSFDSKVDGNLFRSSYLYAQPFRDAEGQLRAGIRPGCPLEAWGLSESRNFPDDFACASGKERRRRGCGAWVPNQTRPQ